MKILAQFGVPAEGFDILRNHQLVIPPLGEMFSREEMFRQLPDTEAMIATKAVDDAMIEAAPKLRIICAYGAGYDNIAVEAATKHDVLVCNVPQTVTNATAELALALMLSLRRRVTEMDKRLHCSDPKTLFRMGMNMGYSLEDATLGVIGMGRIGQRTADLARAFGMHIRYYSRSRKPERDSMGDVYCSLSELLAKSDVVSLHCPSTPETRGLIGREELALMKSDACLINTARGNIVQDKALIAALKEKRIAGAALDVFDGEPNMNPAYLELDNVILVPHIGSNTAQTRYQMAHAIAETILHIDRNERPEHLLNPEAWEHLQSAD